MQLTEMDKVIARYRNYLCHKHSSEHTVETYISEIVIFRNFISASRPECQSWDEVTAEDARNFCYELLSAGKIGRTINRYITSIRLFFDYLVVLDTVKENPFRKVDFFKIKMQPPEVINEPEFVRLLSVPKREYQRLIEKLKGPMARQNGKLNYLRDQFILEMFYYTGIKVCELLKLRDNDIDCNERIVSISDKVRDKKSRILQLPEYVIVTFTDYIKIRNEKWPRLAREANPLILCNKFGNPISDRSIRRNISNYAQKSGLHPGISPGTLRATFALKLLRSKADMATIQYMLGFEDMSSAEAYVSRFKTLRKASD